MVAPKNEELFARNGVFQQWLTFESATRQSVYRLTIDRDRAMQGQSPYIVNAGLYYENKGWVLSLMYNRFGRRILAVGEVFQNPDEDIPDIYEMPRNDLSFGLKKSIGKHWEIKFLASNLLNQDYVECQFAHYSDADGAGHTVRQIPRSYKLGMEFQIGVTFKM